MLIELLIVSVIMTYLYSAGWVEFDSPHAIMVTLVVVAVCGSLGWLLTHYVASSLVNGLLGLDSWTPRKPLKSSLRSAEQQALDVAALERLVREVPKDAELSRRLAEEYLRLGRIDEFIGERLRIVESAVLTREEVCSILNRVADMELRQARSAEAIACLKRIIDRYPDSVEAVNASRRIAVINGEFVPHRVDG